MTTRQIVLVVGAGAGADFNLPLGCQLKHDVARVLSFDQDRISGRLTAGDGTIAVALNHLTESSGRRDYVSYLEAAERVARAAPQVLSIDTFLDQCQGNEKIELCGKLAIARVILAAEHSAIALRECRFVELEKTWLHKFWLLLTARVAPTKLAERFKQFSLIVFNYDRCIEHFLFHSLVNQYNLQQEAAAELVRGLRICHPYGTVGNLDWQGNAPRASFGHEPSPNQLLEISKQLRTYTERLAEDAEVVVRMRESMAAADTVIFLGFAFHPDNVALITPNLPKAGESIPPKRYYATAVNMSEDWEDSVTNGLVNLLPGGGSVTIRRDRDCKTLLADYERSLSAG